MPKMLRTALAVLAGIVLGGFVNMGLITISPMLIPPPAGVDTTHAESLAAGIHLFEPRHFLMPFLAHALGTLAGALVAGGLAAPAHRAVAGWVVGAFYLCGGVAASVIIPAPAWFIALDLLLAYLPMAWLANRVVGRLTAASPARD